jgi:hypothetical protein
MSSVRLFFLPDSSRVSHLSLTPALEEFLTSLYSTGSLDSFILSNDPRSRAPYIQYALKHSCGLLCDKPLFAPSFSNGSMNSTLNQLDSYLKLYQTALTNNKSHYFPFVIQSQRRVHPAYSFLFSLLSSSCLLYNLPISNIEIFHSDGNFLFSHDFQRNNSHHYYNQMGKLYHSGYHFIDLLMILIGINTRINHKKSIKQLYNIHTKVTKPSDWMNKFNGNNEIQSLFMGSNEIPASVPLSVDHSLGPLTGDFDFHLLGQTAWLTDQDQKPHIDCTFSLNLLSAGYSLRRSFITPPDTYKGNGRVRHERLCISLSSIMEIQLHSYQAEELNSSNQHSNESNQTQYSNHVGDYNHFELWIFRNPHVFGGQAVEIVKFPSSESSSSVSSLPPLSYSSVIPPGLSHNEAARWQLCWEFVHKARDSLSSIEFHRSTHWMLDLIQKAKSNQTNENGLNSGGAEEFFPLDQYDSMIPYRY